MKRPRVDILYFEDCPNYEGARALVQRVAAGLGIEPELHLEEVSARTPRRGFNSSARPPCASTGVTSSLAPIRDVTTYSRAASTAVSADYPGRPTSNGCETRSSRLCSE